MKNSSDGSCNTIFLVGTLRSGTMMQRLMIDHHHDITFEGQFEYVTPLISNHGKLPNIVDCYSFLKTNTNIQMESLKVD